MGFALSRTIVYWGFDCAEDSIPYTRSTSSPFSLNSLPLRWSCEASDSHYGFNFESSVHPSIIDAPKGMATGFSAFFFEKLNEESLFLAWALNHP